MSISLSTLLALILVLSMDVFTAGLAYGLERVKIPFLSVSILSLLCAGSFTASLYAGNYLLDAIPLSVAKALSFLVLFLLSLYKFYDAFSQKEEVHTGLDTQSISRKVNRTDKEVLSWPEAALLSLALSLDNVSAGLCTGTTHFSLGLLLGFTVLVHFAAIYLGLFAGRLFPARYSRRFSWLGAAVLMLLSFLRLL